eukprot:5166818-Amphidinium_carterae.1
MWVVGGLVKGLRGTTTDTVQVRCFARMKAFTKVALSVMVTEFPAFDVLMTFSIFNLGAREASSTPEVLRMQHEERLAKLVGVDPDLLRQQVEAMNIMQLPPK